jgi:hypothetical protein
VLVALDMAQGRPEQLARSSKSVRRRLASVDAVLWTSEPQREQLAELLGSGSRGDGRADGGDALRLVARSLEAPGEPPFPTLERPAAATEDAQLLLARQRQAYVPEPPLLVRARYALGNARRNLVSITRRRRGSSRGRAP